MELTSITVAIVLQYLLLTYMVNILLYSVLSVTRK